MAGIKKLGCLGVLSRKTSKNPQKDESYQEGFRTDPHVFHLCILLFIFLLYLLEVFYLIHTRDEWYLFGLAAMIARNTLRIYGSHQDQDSLGYPSSW